MSVNRRTIAYYITPHGFGHAVRSLEVIRHLLQREEALEIILVSDLPDFLVEQNVGRPLPVRRKRLDIGLIQQDSLRFDLEATREALMRLYGNREAVVAQEVAFLEAHRVNGIVSDIPFLPFLAAAECSIPAFGLSNFTWDWIYATYAREDARWDPLITWIREAYRRCDLLLRLPMHGEFSSCPHIRDVPLVARKARRTPGETRAILGIEADQKAYLISFAALDLTRQAQERIETISDVTFFYKRPLRYAFANGRSMDELDLSYTDVVAAVDGVITKPGYGIVSDCLAHGTPILYTDRGLFPEYPILVKEIERSLTTAYIPSEDLYAGRWEEGIRKLEALPRKVPSLEGDGVAVCVDAILGGIGGGR